MVEMDEHQFKQERVWDIPTRLFHWVLAICVGAGWIIGENMSFSNIQWHFYIGYTVGGLVVFRLLWGFIGPQPVRFSALFPRPSAVIAYVSKINRREPSGEPGHNPLGALSVLALLATLSVQVVTGLFAEADDLFSSGPLSDMVDNSTVLLANSVHEAASKVLLALIGVHVGAAVFYLLWKRENLITPMITGLKWVRRK